MVQGILFKFASDVHGLYGNDFAAAKAAGHELQGLMAYFNHGSPDISLPLMALVDYLGFRLIAMILLPISSASIIYGTRDGGHTVQDLSPLFNRRMAQAARKLNLTSHIGGINPTACAQVHSATDIEGHYGTDGRFYLLDLARALPPEKPVAGLRAGHLYRLLRGEFVRSFHAPLCPDAYSGFVINDPQYHMYNRTIDEASQHLHGVVIPSTARTLVEFILEAQEKSKLSPDIISEHLHRTGVNFRHIGRVAAHLPLRSPNNAYRIFYIEAVARTVKNRIRQMLREKLASQRVPTFVLFVQVVVDYLNDIFFHKNMALWREHIIPSLSSNFGFSFPLKDILPPPDVIPPIKPEHRGFFRKIATSAKRKSSFIRTSYEHLPSEELAASQKKDAKSPAYISAQLRRGMSIDMGCNDIEDDATRLIQICLAPFLFNNHSGASILFKRLQTLTGFRFSKLAHEKFASLATSAVPAVLDVLDVEEMGDKVKHMNIVARSQALFYYHNAIQSPEPAHSMVLLRRAKHLFRQALVVDPNHPDTLHQYALARFKLLEYRKPKTAKFFDFKDSSVIETDRYYLRAIDLKKHDPGFLTDYAVFLAMCGRSERAEEYFLRSLEYNANYVKGLYSYGMFLLEGSIPSNMEDAEVFLQMSITLQRQQVLFEQGMLTRATVQLQNPKARRRHPRKHTPPKLPVQLDPTQSAASLGGTNPASKELGWRERRRARKKAEKISKLSESTVRSSRLDLSISPQDSTGLSNRLLRKISAAKSKERKSKKAH